MGITLEVDMSTINRPSSVRAKIGCRMVDKIPSSAEGVLGVVFTNLLMRLKRFWSKTLLRRMLMLISLAPNLLSMTKLQKGKEMTRKKVTVTQILLIMVKVVLLMVVKPVVCYQ